MRNKNPHTAIRRAVRTCWSIVVGWLVAAIVGPLVVELPYRTHAFSGVRPLYHHKRTSSSRLFLAKARNKQMELARKMQQAKAQRQQQQQPNSSSDNEQQHSSKPAVSDDTTKLPVEDDNDKTDLEKQRSEFAKLLSQQKPPPPPQREQRTRISSTAETFSFSAPSKAKTKARDAKKKKQASIAAKNAEKRKKIEQEMDTSIPLKEGDRAKRIDFEALISFETLRPLGPMQAASLVPWVPPYLSDYLVVLADPRRQSGDLRQAFSYLASNLEPEILSNIVVVTPDSQEELSNWLKRTDLAGSPMRLFLDPALDFMKRYSVLTDNDPRWSISLLVFCTNGKIHKHSRNVEPSQVQQLILDALVSIDEQD